MEARSETAMFAPEDCGITVINQPTPVEILPPEDQMGRDEAERCCQKIEHHWQQILEHETSIRAYLVALHDRQGFKALGYASMNDLFQGKFTHWSKSELYREWLAGRIEQSMSLPIGSLRSNHALALKPLAPVERTAVYDAAKSESNGREPTIALLKSAVAARLDTEPDMPSREELFELYSLYGRVIPTPSKKQRNAFKVLREHPASPDELYFDGLKKAWQHWNDETFHQKVEAAIAQYGEYQVSDIPKSCLTCAQRDLKHVGAGEDEIYCYKKKTEVGSDRWLSMAESGCWQGSDGSEADESRAELDRTEGPVVVFQDKGVNVEAIALTVRVKFIKYGAVAYREVPINQILGGFKLEPQ